MGLIHIAAIRLARLAKDLFQHSWLRDRIPYFDDPIIRAQCLNFAIRKPDPSAVRILLALGASPNGLPLVHPDQRLTDETAEIVPLALSMKLNRLVSGEYPELQQKHFEVAMALAASGANLEARCYAYFDFTLRDHLLSDRPDLLAAIEADLEARSIGRTIAELASSLAPLRV